MGDDRLNGKDRESDGVCLSVHVFMSCGLSVVIFLQPVVGQATSITSRNPKQSFIVRAVYPTGFDSSVLETTSMTVIGLLFVLTLVLLWCC